MIETNGQPITRPFYYPGSHFLRNAAYVTRRPRVKTLLTTIVPGSQHEAECPARSKYNHLRIAQAVRRLRRLHERGDRIGHELDGNCGEQQTGDSSH